MGAWPTIPQSRQVKVASSFEHLRDFIRKRMRMSHIYQPVMIKELLTQRRQGQHPQYCSRLPRTRRKPA